jgi:hypothetical protein
LQNQVVSCHWIYCAASQLVNERLQRHTISKLVIDAVLETIRVPEDPAGQM